MSWAAIKLLFTTAKGWLKMLPYILVLIAVLFIGYKTYNWIGDRAVAPVMAQWNKEKSDYAAAIDALRATFAAKEQTHRDETQRINDELAETKRVHDVELAGVIAEYERRLRNSTERAEVYQRQAAGGPTQCISLASHTAKLDKSLEEGRALVEELRRTVGLRDRQLTEVGKQLLADRALYAEPAQEK